MGKVNKRQRKFLTKNVLPHRKKGGKHVDKNSKGKGKRGDEHEAAPRAVPQERRTLPDGLNATSFLDCSWLNRTVCAAAQPDVCVSPFEPEELWLDAPTAAGLKRSKSSSTSSLSEKTVLAMVHRAVDEASMDDLRRLVWSLRESQRSTASNAQSANGHENTAESVRHHSLRAVPGSKACLSLFNNALGRLHLAFRTHLGPEPKEGDSSEESADAIHAHRQKLEKAELWPQTGGALLCFLTTALEHLEASFTGISEAADVPGSGGKVGKNSGKAGKDVERRPPNIKAPAAAPSGQRDNTSLLQGLALMQSHIPLLFPFPRLARRYLAFLLVVLETAESESVLSLAFVRLYELSTSQPMPFLHDAFKAVYQCYRGAAERVGSGGRGGVARGRGVGLGSLPLLRECFSELYGVEKPSAYLHAYVFIHDLIREALETVAEVQKHVGKAREAGPALRRLRSWDFLQSVQLWTSVVAAYPAKSSLGPLVPAVAKLLDITLQFSPGLYGAPRTLALARSAQDLAAASGIFLPTSPYLMGLLELLHSREGRPCPSATAPAGDGAPHPDQRGDGMETPGEADGWQGTSNGTSEEFRRPKEKEDGAHSADQGVVDLSAVAGLGKEDLRLGEVRAAVSKTAAGLIAREAMCYRWSAGLPELCAGVSARLRKLLDGGCLSAEGGSGKCRARVKSLQVTLTKVANETTARRGRGSKHPGEAGPIDTFRGMEESTAVQRLRLFKEPA